MNSALFYLFIALSVTWGQPGDWAKVYKEVGLNSSVSGALNTLSVEEKEMGWELLFDGENLGLPWKKYGDSILNSGWIARDESIHRLSGGGTIMYEKKYTDFVFAIEWKLAEGGNSGIFFHGNKKTRLMYQNAIEMQVLDNVKHPDRYVPSHMAGAIYDVYAPTHNGVEGYDPTFKEAGKSAGFNKVLIIVSGNHHEFWLNGIKTVEYEWNSEDWKLRIENSKFKKYKFYGKDSSGFFGLQDHTSYSWFRNIKVRPLPANASQKQIWVGKGVGIKVSPGSVLKKKGLSLSFEKGEGYNIKGQSTQTNEKKKSSMNSGIYLR